MRGIFFYIIGIAFASGIFTRSFFTIEAEVIGLIFILGLACCLSYVLLRKEHIPVSKILLVGIFCIVYSLGLFRMHGVATYLSPLMPYEGQNALLLGEVVREVEVRENRVHVYVAPIGSDTFESETILVFVDRFDPVASNLSFGDVVKVEGTLTAPVSFETESGRVFDYGGYLRARDVMYTIPFAQVAIEKEEEGTFMGDLFRMKYAFMREVEEVLPEPHAGLGEGILLGVKRALPNDLEESFRETGIIHIVVLSGYNIMIVITCLMFILSHFFFPKTRMVIGISTIALFAVLVGLSATVVRASLMAVLLLIAQSTGRTYAVLRALMLVGTMMLVLNPYLLVHDPGFQLSFLATLGLILLAPFFEEKLTFIPERFSIRGVLTATLSAQIFVLPLLLYQTGLLSFVSIFVNVLVLPIVPFAMLATFLGGITHYAIPILGTGVGYVAYALLEYIIQMASFWSSMSFASITVSAFPFWIVVFMYIGIASFLVHVKKREMIVKDVSIAHNAEEYADWTIVEEKETSPETRSVSGNTKEFPFK